VDQVAENLPSKCEALSSNPSTARKKKRKEKVALMDHQGYQHQYKINILCFIKMKNFCTAKKVETT
jgi:hypothetical protein